MNFIDRWISQLKTVRSSRQALKARQDYNAGYQYALHELLGDDTKKQHDVMDEAVFGSDFCNFNKGLFDAVNDVCTIRFKSPLRPDKKLVDVSKLDI